MKNDQGMIDGKLVMIRHKYTGEIIEARCSCPAPGFRG